MVLYLFSFQALPYVCLLIAMLFFIYAIIGMQVSRCIRSLVGDSGGPDCLWFTSLRIQDEGCFKPLLAQSHTSKILLLCDLGISTCARFPLRVPRYSGWSGIEVHLWSDHGADLQAAGLL